MTTTSTTIEQIDNNASIKVEWKDTLDNYTVQRENEIKKYFINKYKTEKVKVVFSAIMNKKSDMEMEGTADASEMVLDSNYQKQLISRFMNDHGYDLNMAYIDKLDDKVNTHLEDYKDNTSRYKKILIKEVSFSNFLSYGPKNKLTFEKQGLTAVISDPGNYGGKTTGTIDVLMFLFFGDTTKTEKNIDIFNLFSGEDVVTVKGVIELEGETYVIERSLTRTATSRGEYKVVANVDYRQRLPKGGYKNMKGDEKRATEALLKTYVGTKDDFLLTILSTGDNLDDLIKTKPTERGRLLTRYIGLEYFREKERISKKLYDEWKVNAKLHKFSVEGIHKDKSGFESTIDGTEMLIEDAKLKLEGLKGKIEEHKVKQEELLNKRLPIDRELYMIDEKDIVSGIEKVSLYKKERELRYTEALADMVRPTLEFDVHRLAMLEVDIKDMEQETIRIQLEKQRLELENKNLKDSEICQTCKRPLEGVSFETQIAENEGKIKNLVTKFSDYNEKISVSLSEADQIKQVKALWEEFNKKELALSKIKFDIDQIDAKIKAGEEKLVRYRENKENVEKNRQIDTELNVIKSQLGDCEQEKDMMLLNLRGYEKDVENAKRRIDEYNLLLADIKKEELADKIFRVYLEIYGKNGISKMVLSTMIPLINHHLKALLSESAEFVLELRMNDKTEVEFWMIDEGTNISKPLASGSGFEKTVSSLALRCVLTKFSSLPKPNIIVFDEVFSRVSNENLDKIGLFFDKIRSHFENIWLISHNPLITEWADHTIKIRKNNNISEIIGD